MVQLQRRVGLSLTPTKQIPLSDLVELARLADGLGYESIWVPETWAHDAVSVLALLAVHTERIGLASGIFNIYSRSAGLVAQTAATLQEISAGRFILGLGASGPIVVEQWHGVPFRAPIERTRQYVKLIRMMLSGETVYGQLGEMDLAGFRLGNAQRSAIPIYLAALGPRNVRLAGEVANGWLPIFAARSELERLLVDLRLAATAATRDPNDVDIAAYLPAAMGTRGEFLLRQQIAYYIGGMGTFYAAFFSRLGFEREVHAINQLWQSGDRRGAVMAVDERLLDVCTLGSDPSTARARLTQYRQSGVSLPIVVPAHGSTTDETAATIEALAPRTSVF